MMKMGFMVSKELLIKEQSCPYCGTVEEEYWGPDYYICDNCGSLFGRGTLEDSFEYLVPIITNSPESIQRSVPFDIYCSTPDRGTIRRSGLYDPKTMLITQVGPLMNVKPFKVS